MQRLSTLAVVSLLATTALADGKHSPDFRGVIKSEKLTPVDGTRRILAVLWDPHRVGHPAPPKEKIERVLFGARPSMVDWFRESSGGKLTVERAGCLGWYDADKPADHYWAKPDEADVDHDGWVHGHVEKWAEAVHKAAKQFDFAKYDVNHDRVLTPEELGVLVVIPQAGAFGTNRTPAGRESPAWMPLVVDGVTISVLAEWYTGLPANLGAPTHELCHLLLRSPDLYQGPTATFAAKGYSLMDGTYNAAHLDPFEKLKLGWLEVDAVTTTCEVTLGDVETGRRALVLYDPGRGPAEYFLLENRWRGTSYDAGAGPAGGGIRQDGLAIWHVLEDPAVFAKVNPANGADGEWGRRGLRLVRANGGTPLDDAHALFDREGDEVSDVSQPAKLGWIDGSRSGFSVRLLSPPGPKLRLSIVVARTAK